MAAVSFLLTTSYSDGIIIVIITVSSGILEIKSDKAHMMNNKLLKRSLAVLVIIIE